MSIISVFETKEMSRTSCIGYIFSHEQEFRSSVSILEGVLKDEEIVSFFVGRVMNLSRVEKRAIFLYFVYRFNLRELVEVLGIPEKRLYDIFMEISNIFKSSLQNVG